MEHSDRTLADLAEEVLAGRADRERLLEALRPLVVRATRLVVGSGSAAAEDAAQEAMLDLLRGLDGLRDIRAVRSWAMRIAMTRALKVAARERRWWRTKTMALEVGHYAPRERELETIKLAFDNLPARLRAVAVLRLWAGLSEAETAEALACPVGTVKSQLAAARAQLADSLRRDGVVPLARAHHSQEEPQA